MISTANLHGFMILAVTILQAACSTTPTIKELKSSVKDAVANVAGTSAIDKPQHRSIADVPELAMLFKRFPNTNTLRPPRWPRVAITITSVTDNVYSSTRTIHKNTCVSFEIVLWSDAKNRKDFKDLKNCPSDWGGISRSGGVATGKMGEDWMLLPTMANENTGMVRTVGPAPPQKVFPTDNLQYPWVLDPRMLSFSLSSMLNQLGYEYEGMSANTGRVWLVSVPKFDPPAAFGLPGR